MAAGAKCRTRREALQRALLEHARAHELGTTRDWVVIYRDDRDGGGQWTVVTSNQGTLKGKRVVRGRGTRVRGLLRRAARRQLPGRGRVFPEAFAWPYGTAVVGVTGSVAVRSGLTRAERSISGVAPLPEKTGRRPSQRWSCW